MRALLVAPELPRPTLTGAHSRPLSIMHTLVAGGHEVVAVGAGQNTVKRQFIWPVLVDNLERLYCRPLPEA